MSMRPAAAKSYDDKLERMGIRLDKDGQRVMTASTGARARGHQYAQDDGTEGVADLRRADGYESEAANERTMDEKAPKKLRLDRQGFKRGGAVKGKKGTTVNVIVAPQGGGAQAMAPLLAAAAMKGGAGGPPGGPPAGGSPMPPPGMGAPPGGAPMPPPGMMGRKRGGRVPVPMEAGAGSGEGREAKIKAYGSRAKPAARDRAGKW